MPRGSVRGGVVPGANGPDRSCINPTINPITAGAPTIVRTIRRHTGCTSRTDIRLQSSFAFEFWFLGRLSGYLSLLHPFVSVCVSVPYAVPYGYPVVLLYSYSLARHHTRSRRLRARRHRGARGSASTSSDTGGGLRRRRRTTAVDQFSPAQPPLSLAPGRHRIEIRLPATKPSRSTSTSCPDKSFPTRGIFGGSDEQERRSSLRILPE